MFFPINPMQQNNQQSQQHEPEINMALAGQLVAAGMPYNVALVQAAKIQREQQLMNMQQQEFEFKKQQELHAQEAARQEQDNLRQIYSQILGVGNNQSQDNIGNIPNPTLADLNANPNGNANTKIQTINPSPINNLDEQSKALALGLLAKKDFKGAYDIINKNKPTFKDTFEFENKLRDEFVNQSREWQKVNSAYTRIKSAGMEPSAAGDRALIFNYMKMLDPTSTVRESEAATIENARGVSETIRVQWNNILKGEALTPSQRADFIDRASKLYKGGLKDQRILEKRYKGLAESNKLNPNHVIIRYDEPETLNSINTNNSQTIGSQKQTSAQQPQTRQLSRKEQARAIRQERIAKGIWTGK